MLSQRSAELPSGQEGNTVTGTAQQDGVGSLVFSHYYDFFHYSCLGFPARTRKLAWKRRTTCRRSMASLVNSVCLLFLPVALLLMLSPCPAAATRRCHSIYKGFAQCLMALGDSLTDSARKDEDTHEIHSICRSWDEFHDCANVAMAGCPEEAAAVWESLRQESKKMQFSGNLYDMCSNRNNHPAASASPHGSASQNDINQESLRGNAHHLFGCPLLRLLLSPLLLLLFWI